MNNTSANYLTSGGNNHQPNISYDKRANNRIGSSKSRPKNSSNLNDVSTENGQVGSSQNGVGGSRKRNDVSVNSSNMNTKF